MSLRGRNAVVTGSGRGIGRGIALALAGAGCNVAINYLRRRADAEQTAADITALGARAVVIKANMAHVDQAKRLVDQAVEQLGGVDILVCNAASGVMKSILDVGARDWDWTLDINARSALAAAQAAAPHMGRMGWGRIVTVTSIGSQRVFPAYGVVGVSKAALEAVTRYLAVELAPSGIIANCVSPGLVITGALDHFPQRQAMIDHAASHTPAGRLVTPEDVGQVVAWLCSDQASMIVGQTLHVDGGYSLLMTG